MTVRLKKITKLYVRTFFGYEFIVSVYSLIPSLHSQLFFPYCKKKRAMKLGVETGNGAICSKLSLYAVSSRRPWTPLTPQVPMIIC